MKQREINMILSKNAATSADGESLVNLRILDVDLPEIQGESIVIIVILPFIATGCVFPIKI